MQKILQLDLIKALAIIAVIILHSSTEKIAFDLFHIQQAVPVFLIVFALTSAMSFRNRNYTKLKEMFSGDHFLSRIQRILIPVLILYLLPAVQDLLKFGPGFYFISIIIQFVFLFPILYRIYLYNPKLMVVLAFTINLIFEIVIANTEIFNDDFSLYSGSILRFLGAIALGIWISEDLDIFSKRNKYILYGAALSIAYLALNQFFSYDVFPTLLKNQNIIAVFYPVLLILLGIKYLPKEPNSIILKFFSLIGQASYHIYLMQTVFFSLLKNESFLINLTMPILMGLVFYTHNHYFKIEQKKN